MTRAFRVAYVVLSPTFGMHQYTADLAAQGLKAGHDIHLVTTRGYPAHRYHPGIVIHTPVDQHSTGFDAGGVAPAQVAATLRMLRRLRPDVVHFTAVHLWNPLLLLALRAQGIPTVHTLHDLEPHPDVRHGRLIQRWNRWVIVATRHLLVHASATRRTLLARGQAPAAITALPLTHSFLGYALDSQLQADRPAVTYEPWALFFGRFQAYKGIEVLLAAAETLAHAQLPDPWLVLAGAGNLAELWPHPLPRGVAVHQGQIDDDAGWALFQRCGLVVLPYTGATQSALPAAAYAFAKPVLVSDSGALAEVVLQGQTGWITPAKDSVALAHRLHNTLQRTDQLANMGRAGRAWYDAQRSALPEALTTLYRRTIARY